MSLFRSMMGGMDNDMFIGNHMRRMDQMMDNMMMPFDSMFPAMPGGMGFPAITGNVNSLMSFPGFGQSLFPSVDQMFNNIHTMTRDPNCHSYSSSSVMTYTMDGNGQPQVYQASSSTRSAPGGIKETRKSVRNSETGEQHMSIGHHIHEKAHIVEKTRNAHTGQRDETEEFINIEEDQAEEFNNEWVSKTQQRSRHANAAIENSNVEIVEVPAAPLAIAAGPSQPSHSQRHPAHHHSRKREKHELGTENQKSSHRSKKTGHRKSSKYSCLPRHESHM